MGIKLDRKNARKHSAQNKSAIEQSLATVGAARGVVSDSGENILAGNGIAEAWLRRGGKIKVVETTGDELVVTKRVDVSPDSDTARQIATLDNLTSDTSAFDYNLDLLREALRSDAVSNAIAQENVNLQRMLSMPAGQVLPPAVSAFVAPQMEAGPAAEALTVHQRPEFSELIEDMAASHASGVAVKDACWFYVEFYGQPEKFQELSALLAPLMSTASKHEILPQHFERMVRSYVG